MLGGARTFLAVPPRRKPHLLLSRPVEPRWHGPDPRGPWPSRRPVRRFRRPGHRPDSGGHESAHPLRPHRRGGHGRLGERPGCPSGDAAHATSPNMAQGAAMAFEDAAVLAECLADQASVKRALETYTSRRLPRIRWVREQSHRRDRIRSLPAPVRNVSLQLAGKQIYRSNYAPLMAEVSQCLTSGQLVEV